MVSFTAYGYSGANVSSTPMRLFKHWEYEGGTATPFIAYSPAIIKRHFQTDKPGHIIDIMATCLDVAEVPYPQIYDGHTLSPPKELACFRL